MEKNKNQKQPNMNPKDRKSGKQQENTNHGRYERKNDPVANQGSGSEKSQTDRSREQSQGNQQQSGEWKRPLTNQDEQRKPTNTGASNDTGLNEEEQEGDSSQERIKPYKNMGDDSKEVERKTPSME